MRRNVTRQTSRLLLVSFRNIDGRDDQPVVQISWDDAVAYAKWTSKRLPAEASGSTPRAEFVDDGPGKPVGINRFIGRRPTMAFGNSDGDLQMLQYTTSGKGPCFGLIVHHTDDGREVAYDRASHIGKLDKALDEARAKGWIIVDMKNDWKTVFPFN